MEQGALRYGPGLVHDADKFTEIAPEEFSRCRDEIDAVWMALRWRGMKPTDRELSEALRDRGIPASPGQLNLIINRGGSTGRRRNPPVGFYQALQDYTQTNFMEAYLASRRLPSGEARRIAELRAEYAALTGGRDIAA